MSCALFWFPSSWEKLTTSLILSRDSRRYGPLEALFMTPMRNSLTCWLRHLSRKFGRDALPRDPRQDVRWLSSGAAPLIVYAFRRVRRRTSTDAFQTCDAGRARVQLRSETGTPDMTAADRAGARPYLRRRLSGSALLFLGLHTQKRSLVAAEPDYPRTSLLFRRIHALQPSHLAREQARRLFYLSGCKVLHISILLISCSLRARFCRD